MSAASASPRRKARILLEPPMSAPVPRVKSVNPNEQILQIQETSTIDVSKSGSGQHKSLIPDIIDQANPNNKNLATISSYGLEESFLINGAKYGSKSEMPVFSLSDSARGIIDIDKTSHTDSLRYFSELSKYTISSKSIETSSDSNKLGSKSSLRRQSSALAKFTISSNSVENTEKSGSKSSLRRQSSGTGCNVIQRKVSFSKLVELKKVDFDEQIISETELLSSELNDSHITYENKNEEPVKTKSKAKAFILLGKS